MQQAETLADVFKFNACTPDIHNHLVARVQAVGLFGVLREVTVPLVHCGISLHLFQAGPDLEKLHMSPQDAESYMQQLLSTLDKCNATIYGEDQLPLPTGSPIMLQSVVDLLCCDWDRVKLFTQPYLASRQQQGCNQLQ